MAKLRSFFSLYFLNLLFLYLNLHFIVSHAQSSAPSGPTNITAILEKAGQFATFIRLLKSTLQADQLNSQLKISSSNQGFTIFAPTDNAFNNLKSGTLNSLSDQQKVQLVQFHILPTVLSMSQFQTVSNPLRTQVGDAQNGQFPLNVTSIGNQVNVTTGVVNASVANTIYSDKHLAVYQVDQVLLPLGIFGSSPIAAPVPAPGPEKGGSVSKGSSSGDDNSSSTHASGAERRFQGGEKTLFFQVGIAAAVAALWIR